MEYAPGGQFAAERPFRFRFDYMERGILDRTHLRFFTLRSLRQLMAEASCHVLNVIPTPLPVQIVFPFTDAKAFQPLHEILYAITRSWRTLFAYQYVLIATPDSARSAPSLFTDSEPEHHAEKVALNR